MRLHTYQRVLCICRGGQVRSVAARNILCKVFGFMKVIAAGWEMNDADTIKSLCEWADAVIVVGRPGDWNINTPPQKTLHVEVGEDVWGRYNHPELLELLKPKLEALL